jgi:signal transduction histidine kinase
LARGIAHDFNNILWALSGNIEYAVLFLSKKTEARDSLEDALKSIGRAQKLIRQILTFSRGEDFQLSPIELGPIVKEAITFLKATIRASIEIRSKIADEGGLVNADPTQMYQVLINLCTNAEHAMRQKGGILEIVLDRKDLKEYIEAWDAELSPGSYIRLMVKDSGYGIAPEDLDHIFDPYYSTKPKREGTGLGLSVVHGIVKSHHGAIIVKSAPGEGARFSIYLPRVEKK